MQVHIHDAHKHALQTDHTDTMRFKFIYVYIYICVCIYTFTFTYIYIHYSHVLFQTGPADTVRFKYDTSKLLTHIYLHTHVLQADLVDPVRFKQFYAFAFEISRYVRAVQLILSVHVQISQSVRALCVYE